MKARVYLLVLMLAIAPFAYSAPAQSVAQGKSQSNESRHLLQAVVPSKITAQSMVDAIRAGESFATAAGREGFTPADLEVGQTTERDFAALTSPALAREVFKRPPRDVVGPYQTDLGWHIVAAISGPVRKERLLNGLLTRDWKLIKKDPDYIVFVSKTALKGGIILWYIRPEADQKGVVSSTQVVRFDCTKRLRTLISLGSLDDQNNEVENMKMLEESTEARGGEVREMHYACGKLNLPSAKPSQDALVWFFSLGRGPLAKDVRWRYLASTSTNDVYKYDSETVTTNGQFTEMWVEGVNSTRTARGQSSKMLISYDCLARASAILSSVTYRADGSVLESWSSPAADAVYQPVVPSTIQDAGRGVACTRN